VKQHTFCVCLSEKRLNVVTDQGARVRVRVRLGRVWLLLKIASSVAAIRRLCLYVRR